MKSWDRLFSFNYVRLKHRLADCLIYLRNNSSNNSGKTNFNKNNNNNSNNSNKNTKTKLIVASTSLLSSSAYFYYHYLNSNDSKSLALAKTVIYNKNEKLNGNQDEYEEAMVKSYRMKKECSRLIKRYKVILIEFFFVDN
jgi:hypothetical protein